jgi:hypothetical protein
MVHGHIQHVHTLTIHTIPSLYTHYTHYTPTIHPLYTHYTPTIHPLYAHYTLTRHSLYTPGTSHTRQDGTATTSTAAVGASGRRGGAWDGIGPAVAWRATAATARSCCSVARCLCGLTTTASRSSARPGPTGSPLINWRMRLVSMVDSTTDHSLGASGGSHGHGDSSPLGLFGGSITRKHVRAVRRGQCCMVI